MNHNKKVKVQKELLIKLKDEVTEIEKQIKGAKYQNIKIAGVKSLKIFKHISVGLLPLVLTTGLVIGSVYVIGGGLPFILDDINQKENVMKQFDSKGSYRYERHFENLSQNNQLLVCSNWSLNESGLYQRQVDRYNFEKYTEEDIINFVNSGDITKITGIPYSYTEEKNELTDEELQNNEQYIQATLYSVNDDNIRVIKESSSDNTNVTFIEMLFILFIGGIATSITWNSYNPLWKIKKVLRDSEEKIDVELLRKKLSIRQDNLNRIMNR